jgi:hypothetical protein
MKRGVVDAAEEARRMSEPIIRLTDKELAIARNNGIRVSKDGKVSRDGATLIWKFARRALGEPSHSEYLRRD